MRNQQEPELTRREFQVLELVAKGYSAKEVAQEIDIAPRTVEGHIDTIKLKLRARNRTHMVTRAIAAHVLTICEDEDMPMPIPGESGVFFSEMW
jgi:DNA-binding CsgD family transcriptional regulator